ncbi:alpha/beta fold hydrolase [Paracoccus sp. (in: a-proteobacteria)]|uniref:alpha/beta fold hydrolase n=1 Tax=Paracoccus sp. TaxID=267 RepID=UPI0026DF32D4|nr:alpha/beta fold hydrolase [Paracoccus sp. (in: a-proteobacteria)]MDO5648253.1 alpha/beta fold hydrolase [Paracoccus sp. (in: a-proteobacteria)]
MKDVNVSMNGFSYLKIGKNRVRVYARNMDADGIPLLICNGLGQAVEMLFPLMDELGDRPIISFDAIGVGRSSVPKGHQTTIPEHADAVADMLDQLGIEQVDLLGISWGGAVSQQFVHSYPERVRRLILSITSPGGILTWWGTPIAISEILFPMRYSNKLYGNFIGPLMYGGEALLAPSMFAEYSRRAIKPNYYGYIAQVNAMCSWTSIPFLREIEHPTQIIGGTFDALIPLPNQIALAEMIPNAQLKVYPAGHLLMYSLREEVGELIKRFLA